MRILSIIGTRPEAIKMAPVITLLKKDNRFDTVVCTTSQHKEMLDSALSIFGISADFDLAIMHPNQNLFEITVNILNKIEPVILKTGPDLILVQGDTTTTFIAALAAFYSNIKTGHIEAGLRTYRKDAPYPEEINRQLVSRLADYHFAPTLKAKQNLINENIDESLIHVTGNTVIDALYLALAYIQSRGDVESQGIFPEVPEALWSCLKDSSKKLIMVTRHRRENFGSGIKNLCLALKELAQRHDVVIVFPVHLNPNVKIQVEEALANRKNIFLLRPLDYLTFVHLMNACHFIITDSGGIQEEAPSLGKPVLVTRDITERLESVEVETVKLVGTNTRKIVDTAIRLLDDPNEYEKMAFSHNPYGNGKAAKRIIDILVKSTMRR